MDSIRRAALADFPAIAALLRDARLPVEGALGNPDDWFVAFDPAGLTGCGGLEVYGAAALLRSVAVAERARGRGTGTRMVQTLLGHAEARAVHQVYLLTETADAWFPRFGFEPIERDRLPDALDGSAELNGACAASARAFQLSLRAVAN